MKYSVEIYSGRIYCGNAFKETYEECMKWFEEDGFCDRAKITDLETGKKYIVKINR